MSTPPIGPVADIRDAIAQCETVLGELGDSLSKCIDACGETWQPGPMSSAAYNEYFAQYIAACELRIRVKRALESPAFDAATAPYTSEARRTAESFIRAVEMADANARSVAQLTH